MKLFALSAFVFLSVFMVVSMVARGNNTFCFTLSQFFGLSSHARFQTVCFCEFIEGSLSAITVLWTWTAGSERHVQHYVSWCPAMPWISVPALWLGATLWHFWVHLFYWNFAELTKLCQIPPQIFWTGSVLFFARCSPWRPHRRRQWRRQPGEWPDLFLCGVGSVVSNPWSERISHIPIEWLSWPSQFPLIIFFF